MNKIGGYSFPQTPEEADAWTPHITYTAIHTRVLLVAKTRMEGEWACYCTPVPGRSHDNEKHLWQNEGTKVREAVARAAFPQFAEIPYNY